MRLVFTTRSWDDYLYWQQNDKRVLRRINGLIKDIQRGPFEGTGKPEPLKHQLQGLWSLRIHEEHCLIYEVTEDELRIIACRYHYWDLAPVRRTPFGFSVDGGAARHGADQRGAV